MDRAGIRLIGWAATLLLLFGVQAKTFAAPSGLFLIPTTEFCPARCYTVEFQVDGSLARRTADSYFVNTEFALTDRIEAGIDADLSEDNSSRLFLNGKVLLIGGPSSSFSMAAGVITMLDEHVDATSFLVGSLHLSKGAKGHVGMIRVHGRNRIFTGFEAALREGLVLMADCIDGPDNESSIGLSMDLKAGVSVMAGLIKPNGGGSFRYSIHLVFSWD